MATQLQFRRGTSAQNNSYTGLVGEISLDTDTNNIRIHDGSTAGGAEIIPSGTIVAYGAASAPTGWLLCDNSAVSRTTYARLFAVIGTGYGVGDGSTTFNVPDLRDKVPLGKGTNNATLGYTAGSAGANGVLTSATKTGVTTATSNTGTGNTGTSTSGSSGATTVASNTGTGNTGNATSTTVASNTGNSQSTTVGYNATNAPTVVTGSSTSGSSGATTVAANTGNSQSTTVASNTGAGGSGGLTLTVANRNDTLGVGAKDVTQIGIVTNVTQTNHTHSVPSLTVNNHSHSVPALTVNGHTHSIPALTIPSLTVNNHTHSIPSLTVNNHSHSIPALTVPSLTVNGHTHSVPALSVPALSIPALTVNGFTVATTLPSEVVQYIIKT